MSATKFLAGFIVGGAIGAIAGVLLAPKSGEETRALIADSAKDAVRRADETGISVNEIEKEIDEKTYNSLEKNDKYITINKDRYIIPYKNHKIELDIFKDKYEGIIFAEIEFESVEIANNFEFPKWFGKEISENITNAEMATNDMKSVIKDI